MIKLKTLLYLIPNYQLIDVTYNRKNKAKIHSTAIKDDLIEEPCIINYIVTSIRSLNDILYVTCEERKKH